MYLNLHCDSCFFYSFCPKGLQRRSCVLERKTIFASWETAGEEGERMKNRVGRRGCRRTGRTVLYVLYVQIQRIARIHTCLLVTATHSFTHTLSLSLSVSRYPSCFLFSGAESVLPGLGRPLSAGKHPAYSPAPDPCGKTPVGRQLSHRPEFGAPAEV